MLICRIWWTIWILVFLFFLRATPAAYEGSPAKGWIRAAAACLHHSHSNAGSLTHWPRIKPASSWILVGFLTTEPQQELPILVFFKHWVVCVFTVEFWECNICNLNMSLWSDTCIAICDWFFSLTVSYEYHKILILRHLLDQFRILWIMLSCHV